MSIINFLKSHKKVLIISVGIILIFIVTIVIIQVQIEQGAIYKNSLLENYTSLAKNESLLEIQNTSYSYNYWLEKRNSSKYLSSDSIRINSDEKKESSLDPNDENVAEDAPQDYSEGGIGFRILLGGNKGLNHVEKEVKKGNTTITVYAYNNFGEPSKTFRNIVECFTLPDDWQMRISSINSHGNCVEICQYRSCFGRCLRLEPGTPGHNRLRDINFDKRTTSIRPCEMT